jgi:hypothetical protein
VAHLQLLLHLLGSDALSTIITSTLPILLKYIFTKHTIKGKQSFSSVVSHLIFFIICTFSEYLDADIIIILLATFEFIDLKNQKNE